MGISIRTPATEEEWDAYYELRYRVLREPLKKERGSERDDGDATGVHFGLYEQDGRLLRGIARLDQPLPKVAQVRFVAIDTEVQGRGYGTILMKSIEARALDRGDMLMKLHARDYAVRFYARKLGYRTIGASYKLFGVLQHYEMRKVLLAIRSPITKEEWDGYYDLRYRLLLKPLNQERGSEQHSGDGDEKNVHLAIFHPNIKAVARVDRLANGVTQARFVAVDEDVQRAGYGSILMEKAEEVAIARGEKTTRMILHARDSCVDFYKRKHGYEVVEKSYLLFDTVQHYLMKKTLRRGSVGAQ